MRPFLCQMQISLMKALASCLDVILRLWNVFIWFSTFGVMQHLIWTASLADFNQTLVVLYKFSSKHNGHQEVELVFHIWIFGSVFCENLRPDFKVISCKYSLTFCWIPLRHADLSQSTVYILKAHQHGCPPDKGLKGGKAQTKFLRPKICNYSMCFADFSITAEKKNTHTQKQTRMCPQDIT